MLCPRQYSTTSLTDIQAFGSFDVIFSSNSCEWSILRTFGPVKIQSSIFAFDRYGNKLEMYFNILAFFVQCFRKHFDFGTFVPGIKCSL